jgi:hypothetical protein
LNVSQQIPIAWTKVQNNGQSASSLSIGIDSLKSRLSSAFESFWSYGVK